MATTDIGEILGESVPAKLKRLTDRLNALAETSCSVEAESLAGHIRELADIVADVYRESQLPF